MPETESTSTPVIDSTPPLAAVPHRRYSLASALLFFILVRALILLVAYNAPQDRSPSRKLWWVDMPLARWDYGHYCVIMESGYPPDNPMCEQIAFFPGYPLVGRLLLPFVRSDWALPLVSMIASTIAACFIYLWAKRLYDARVAFWCIVLLSVYPPAMFFCAGYADALLLLCVAVAFWCLQKGWIYGAALASAFSTLTRPTGLALAAVIVLWAWFYSKDKTWVRRGLRLIPIGTIAIAGFIAFQAYLWHHYGRPDAFVATQSNWGYKKPIPNPIERILTLKPVVQPALKPIIYAARGQFDKFTDPLLTWNPMFNLIVLVISIAGLIRPGPIPRVLYLLGIFVFLMAYLPDPYRGARMIGIARYHLIALPVFLSLSVWMSRRWPRAVHYSLLIGLLALECMYARQFANWQYIG